MKGKFGKPSPPYHKNQDLEMLCKAISGDFLLKPVQSSVEIANDTQEKTVPVQVQAVDSNGEIHSWLNYTFENIASKVGIGTLPDGTVLKDADGNETGNVIFKNGVATVNAQIASGDYAAQGVGISFGAMQINAKNFTPVDIAIITPGGSIKSVTPYTARSVVFDFADNHGNNGFLGIRSIDFYRQGKLIELTPDGAFPNCTCYATSDGGQGTEAKEAFKTGLSYIDNSPNNAWLSAFFEKANQRLIIVFDTAIEFDQIMVNNAHDSGSITDVGAKNAKVTITDADYTTTAYNAAVTGNSKQIWEGSLVRHVSDNVRDDIELQIGARPFKAGWLVMDIADNYGYANFINIRTLELFDGDGNELDVQNDGDTEIFTQNNFTGHEASRMTDPDTPKDAVGGWMSSITTDNRISLWFDKTDPKVLFKFTKIVINNGWLVDNTAGAKSVKIYITDYQKDWSFKSIFEQTIPGTVTKLFDGDFPARTAGDTPEDWAVPLATPEL